MKPLPSSHGFSLRCLPLYKEKKQKSKKKKTKKQKRIKDFKRRIKKKEKFKKKKKSFENVRIKSNILMKHLHVLLTILITWMFTLCMILTEYFMRNNAQNMYNMVIHERLL